MFWVAWAGLAATCLAALGARSLAEFSPRELKERCQRRNRPDRLGQILKQRDRAALAAETLQVLGTVAFVVAAVSWRMAAVEGQPGPHWLACSSDAAVGVVLLLAAEIWLPWGIARLWADPFLDFTWPAWRALCVAAAALDGRCPVC